MKKIIFAMAGVGLGNCTRDFAILEKLEHDVDINIVASGNAYNFFKDKYKTYRLKGFNYSGNEKINIIGTILLNWSFLYKFIINNIKAIRIVQKVKPDLIIVDSDLSFFLISKFKKLPLIAINTSPIINKQWAALSRKGKKFYLSFYCIESLEYLLLKYFADIIICPSLEKYDFNNRKIRQVDLIVRDNYIQKPEGDNLNKVTNSLCIMLGGSGLGAKLDLASFSRGEFSNIAVIGNSKNNLLKNLGNYKGVVDNSIDYLTMAKYVVIQAGLSSLSEVVALKKPFITMPIHNHVEQYLNATFFTKFGFGIIAFKDNLSMKLSEFAANYALYEANYKKHNIKTDGAEKAAEIISDYLR